MKALGFAALSLLVVIVVINVFGSAKRAEADHRAEYERQRLAMDLKNNKPTILRSASELIEQERFPQAISALAPYSSAKDPDIEALLKQANVRFWTIQLRRLPREMHSARLDLLNRIIATSGAADSQLTDERDREEKLAQHELVASAEKAAKIAKLSEQSFCHQLQQHAGEYVFSNEFETRGGRSEYLGYITKRQIQIGMNEFEIRCAWGAPSRVNRTLIGTRYQSEQWIFGDSTYVYVENGVMTSLQDSR